MGFNSGFKGLKWKHTLDNVHEISFTRRVSNAEWNKEEYGYSG